jgi:hypothetical protein
MIHCPEAGGKHVAPPHFRLMMACAEIGRTSAHFMLINTPHHRHVCRECAEICEKCSRDCAKIGDMGECVTACNACAEDGRFSATSWNVNLGKHLSPIANRRWENFMKLTTIGLAAALMLSSPAAFAQGGTGGAGGGTGGTAGAAAGSTATSTNPGGSAGTTGSTTGSGNNGLSNQAGSAAAGANSAQNPSGNTYLNNNVPGMSGAAPGASPGRR